MKPEKSPFVSQLHPDPGSPLASANEVPFSPFHVPLGDAFIGGATSNLDKTVIVDPEAGVERGAFNGRRSRGDMKITWRTDWPSELDEDARKFWIRGASLVKKTTFRRRGEDLTESTEVVPLASIVGEDFMGQAMLAHANAGSPEVDCEKSVVYYLRLLPVEFKGNKKNLTTRLDQFPEPIGGLEYREYDSVFPDSDQHHLWNKVTCVLWNASPGKIDLIDHVQGADRATLEAAVEWQVNGNTQASSEISMGSKPFTDSYRPFYVKVVPKGGGKVIDRLIITLVPPETKANFDAWYAAESTAAGKAWFAELPPMPSSLEVAPSLLAPDRNYPSAARLYYDPSTTATYMHPDARFELRSKATAGGHAHQVCFTSSGGLILSGVSAGSADKRASFHFPDVTDPQPHVDADVTPFVWSLQLDGNPCNRPPLSATLSKPMLHQGANLDKYFECRPAEPNGKPKFAPGSTP